MPCLLQIWVVLIKSLPQVFDDLRKAPADPVRLRVVDHLQLLRPGLVGVGEVGAEAERFLAVPTASWPGGTW